MTGAHIQCAEQVQRSGGERVQDNQGLHHEEICHHTTPSIHHPVLQGIHISALV